jgi:hypothetical protein
VKPIYIWQPYLVRSSDVAKKCNRVSAAATSSLFLQPVPKKQINQVLRLLLHEHRERGREGGSEFGPAENKAWVTMAYA